EEAVDVDGYDHLLVNNLSYKPTLSGAECVNFDLSLSSAINNTFLPDIQLADKDFESLDAGQLLRARNADGSLPDITFLKLKPSGAAYQAKIGYQFDEITGIETVIADPVRPSDYRYYNLQGIQVENPAHGLYIHNGKKIYIP
ncbi:MAG: pectate lyase, partial [Duncaniella sp.]|nr:pectate lyase [Duncaniella sp.]